MEARAELRMVVGKSSHTVGAYREWIPQQSCFSVSSDLRIVTKCFPWRAPTPEVIPPAAPSLAPSTVLYLFSGEFGRQGGLREHLERAGAACVEFDNGADLPAGCRHGGVADDLLNGEVYARLRQRVIDGEFTTIVASPPCSTYSVTRALLQGLPRPASPLRHQSP